MAGKVRPDKDMATGQFPTTVTATTPSNGDNSTKIATTAFLANNTEALNIASPLNDDMLVYDSGASEWINRSILKRTTQAGTTYTLQDSDINSLILFTSATAVALTVPSGLRADFNCGIAQVGAGKVTFTPSSTTIVNVDSLTKTRGAGAMATIVATSTDNYITQGAME